MVAKFFKMALLLLLVTGATEVKAQDTGKSEMQQWTYIASTYHFVSYTASPYWWWGFADYWSPSYWGNWGYWYYPHPVHFSVSTGALLTDMLNLKAKQGDDKRLPVVWQSYLTGLLHGSDALNVALAARGVEQAFRQSEYITTNH